MSRSPSTLRTEAEPTRTPSPSVAKLIESAPAINTCCEHVVSATQNVEGWIAERELRFLTWLGAFPTCDGEVLELGSFDGKSTIALASGIKLFSNNPMTTVDVRPPESLLDNLQKAEVRDWVEVRQADSRTVTKSWQRPLRLIWHDGANDYPTVHDDLQQLLPFLGDGGIVAMHDVLNHSGERIRCFCEQILDSDDFGAAGIIGSIGWAQKRSDPERNAEHQQAKQKLFRQLHPLIPYHNFSGPQSWPKKLLYKWKRSRVPHGEPAYETWAKQVA